MTRPPGDKEWPNYQTYCYGFWLRAVADHVRRGGVLDDVLRAAVRLTHPLPPCGGKPALLRLLGEHPGHLHTSSLAAVAAGLRDAGRLVDDQAAAKMSARLVDRITGPDHTPLAGSFIRYPGDTRVDGSLLWIGVPFALIEVGGAVASFTAPPSNASATSSTNPKAGCAATRATPSTAAANGYCSPHRWMVQLPHVVPGEPAQPGPDRQRRLRPLFLEAEAAVYDRTAGRRCFPDPLDPAGIDPITAAQFLGMSPSLFHG